MGTAEGDVGDDNSDLAVASGDTAVCEAGRICNNVLRNLKKRVMSDLLATKQAIYFLFL